MLARNARVWGGRVRWNDGLGSLFDLGTLPASPGLADYALVLDAAPAGVFELMVHPVRDASAVAGLTYSFENEDTDYRNGVDAHVEWSLSQFVNESMHVGLVGYFLQQVSGDSGAGAVLGDFKSRVAAVGPQVGVFFPVGRQKAYANLKGYWEFDAKNRIEGWNVWLTVSLPLSGW